MSGTGDRRPPPGLAEAIVMGLRALRDLTRPPPEVTSGDLEHVLRTAIARSGTADGRPVGEPAVSQPLGNAAVAARTACAYLSARDLPHAYLALRAAREALPREPHETTRAEQQDMSCVPGASSDEADRAEAVAAQLRALAELSGIEQAAGILAQVGGTSADEALDVLRHHAERHRLVLTELAADLIAGRVDPTGITSVAAART